MTDRFFAIHTHGLVRVASCTPRVRIADPASNAAEILQLAQDGERQGVDLLLFPELGLSAYAVDDLFLQETLLDAVATQLAALVVRSKSLAPVLIVQAPWREIWAQRRGEARKSWAILFINESEPALPRRRQAKPGEQRVFFRS